MEELVMSFLELEELYDILIEEEKKIKEGVYSPFVISILEKRILEIRDSLDNLCMTSATFKVAKKDKDAIESLMGTKIPQQPVMESPVQAPPAIVMTLGGEVQYVPAPEVAPAPEVQATNPFNPNGLEVLIR